MARRRRRIDMLGNAVVAPPTPPRQLADQPMTPKQLAGFLSVSVQTIRRQLPEIPHIRVGNRVRFMPAEVIAHYKKKRRDGGGGESK